MKRNDPIILASNLSIITAVVLVILWPVTGKGLFGVLALALVLLSGAFAGINATNRGKRNASRKHDHGDHS